MHLSLLSAFATVLRLRCRLAYHLLLQPFLGFFPLGIVHLLLAEDILEPEFGTFQVGFQVCHLSSISTNAIVFNVAFLLGASDSFVK